MCARHTLRGSRSTLEEGCRIGREGSGGVPTGVHKLSPRAPRPIKNLKLKICGTLNNVRETWKPIPIKGYETHYEVSSFGRIRNTKRIMSPRTYENGYIKANLTNNAGKTKILRGVHRLVAISFIPNPLRKPCVNHKDNNPQNNRIENLEWVTHQENKDHSVRQNRHAKGEKVGSAKLSPWQVLKIRKSNNPITLGEKYGVCSATIYSLLSRATWKHI